MSEVRICAKARNRETERLHRDMSGMPYLDGKNGYAGRGNHRMECSPLPGGLELMIVISFNRKACLRRMSIERLALCHRAAAGDESARVRLTAGDDEGLLYGETFYETILLNQPILDLYEERARATYLGRITI